MTSPAEQTKLPYLLMRKGLRVPPTPAACHVQLALDNALAPFFESNFGFGITKAANLAAIFGMLNFVARPCGGLCSDLAARRFGMRGRIWVLWTVVACGGAFPRSWAQRTGPQQ